MKQVKRILLDKRASRADRTNPKFTAPKKDLCLENLKIDFEGNYLIISNAKDCHN